MESKTKTIIAVQSTVECGVKNVFLADLSGNAFLIFDFPNSNKTQTKV